VPETIARAPYDHALYLINEVNRNINEATLFPDGRSRGIDSTALSGVLNASSNLAIASALLAVADAIRARNET
jgi:hypothetical protein